MKTACFILAALLGTQAYAQKIGGADIGGVVSGPKGPEAGVWVIAETSDLPTKYAKVVVTDEKGRYLIPELPKANYTVWVRGYGLADSAKAQAAPGKRVNINVSMAPSSKAAAELYPGMYWYSMLKIPPKSDFPGSGDKGNGISENIKSQEQWVDTVKNACQSCHALGSAGIRKVPEVFAKEGDSFKAWARRTQAGQAMTNMATGLGYMGIDAALKNFADWTDRVAAGELPFAQPERPKGVERNVVITMWDWATNKAYLHDSIATDKDKPTVNANGKIYGAPEESTDMVPVLDPKTHTASQIKHPYKDPETPSSTSLPKGTSAYWGDEPIWDGHTSIHNPIMDREGRVWFTSRIRPAGAQPKFCTDGSIASSKVAPLKESPRHLSMYDPKSGKWQLIDTCFPTHHLYFDPKNPTMLWTSAGGPGSGVVGWLDTKKYLESGNDAASQGWTPIIVDTNGNGVRDDSDTKLRAAFYGVTPSPVDESIWGQSMGIGFARMNQPGFLMRIIPGANPAETALTEVFVPPAPGFSPRGIDMGTDGVVWTPLASGHIASFDRRKCKAPVNGPDAASGKLCQEGWTLYRMPGPQFKGLDEAGSANHAYYLWVDRYNTFGLGRNVPIAQTNGSESLMAVVDGKIVDFRVPYPLGFFTKNVDGRIDDAKAGWKGRALWTTSGTRTNFHNEGGKENRPKVYKLQLRPNPLAS
jgi:hypothetical protein